MNKPGIRLRAFERYLEITGHNPGEMLRRHQRIVYTVLFPIRSLHYSVERKEGYQVDKNTWIIHGVEYSDELFRHFAYGGDETFRIIKRDSSGTPVIQREIVN